MSAVIIQGRGYAAKKYKQFALHMPPQSLNGDELIAVVKTIKAMAAAEIDANKPEQKINFDSATVSSDSDFESALEAYNKKDYRTAYSLYFKLAEQGYAGAQNNLGVMYENGEGVPQDYREGVKWYRMAAEQGYAVAQNNLGVIYDTGQGVLQDYKEAVKWYRLAADQGYANAQNNLGVIYANGRGVLLDHKEAVKWYRLAVEQGSAMAKCNLAELYAAGLGVRIDIALAKKLAKEGFDEGASYCEDVWKKYNLANH